MGVRGLSTLKRYKELEKNLYQKGILAAGKGRKDASSKFKRFVNAGKRKMTIMLVPHSEKRVVNLQFSFFVLFGIGFATLAVIITLSVFGVRYGEVSSRLNQKTASLKTAQANLDSIRDETTRLFKSAQKFQGAISETLGSAAIDPSKAGSSSAESDLSAFFSINESATGTLKEASEIHQLSSYLDDKTEQMQQLNQLVGTNRYALKDIPTLWPIKSGKGQISMYFGQNRNPFTHLWYIHKGLDIATFGSGDPIAATAEGEVIEATYASDYGNYVTIKHRYGIYTRYAHMQSFRVVKGQKVQQGEIIGYLGATGMVTGPHLHYEVHLGTDVVDPLKFLNRPKPQAKYPAGNL
jgi:murein DD-endopeptidase MepM/ murein hydrolase activator NlpD